MITGFNTDVKHETKVFHVQTEDRGLANPVVESLVYVGGEILLSKKSPYRDLISGDHVDEKALREMMDLQHRRVIEAVRRGRLDKGKIGDAPADWADDTLPHTEKVSAAALAAVSAILSAPPEPLPGDRRVPDKPARVTTSAASPAFVPPPPPPAPAVVRLPAPRRSASRLAASGRAAQPARAAGAARPARGAGPRAAPPLPRRQPRRSRNPAPRCGPSTRSSSTISPRRPLRSTSRSRSPRTASSSPARP